MVEAAGRKLSFNARKLSFSVLLPATAWMAVGAAVAQGQVVVTLPAPTAAAATTAPAAAAGAASDLTFDVASVRPSAMDMAKLQAALLAGKMPRMGAHVDASRAEYDWMTLKSLIAAAYDVKEYQISGPDWLNKSDAQRFDIVAKMPEGASKDDAPKMLRALLAERFNLKAHFETQEHAVLALVVGKGGAKLKDSPAAAAPIDPDAPLKPGETSIDGPDGPVRITRNSNGTMTENMGAKGTYTIKMDGQTIHMEADTMTMAGFADMLTGIMQMGGAGGKQVVDMTALKGNYQVAVDLSMADIMAAAKAQGVGMPGGGGGGTGGTEATAASDPGGGGDTAYASVEKLGLKLESRKAPVKQVVVDSAEKTPTEN
jgi:uncharacterized protein (TIGR03435 family)